METKSTSCLPINQSCQRVDLVSEMYSQITIAGVNIVLAALSEENCGPIFGIKDQLIVNDATLRIPHSGGNVLEVLKRVVNGNERLQLFFNNSSTAICDKICIDGDKLELQNLWIMNVHQPLMPLYRPFVGTQGSMDSFILFGFYELPP